MTANEMAPAPQASGTVKRLPQSGPAEVRALLGSGRVELEAELGRGTFVAELAAASYTDPSPGDQVLYFTDEAGRRYVIGVLGGTARHQRAPTRSALEEMLDAAEGTSSPAFLRDPESGATVLRVEEGDLVLEVPHGQVHIFGREGATLESAGTATVRSARAVVLEAIRGERPGRVEVQPGEVTIAAAVCTLAAERAELMASRIAIRAKRMDTHVTRMKQVAEVMEIRTNRLVERARDAYREVTHLSQHRAGRLRWVAEKTATLVSRDAILKARNRMKIKGERIHLA